MANAEKLRVRNGGGAAHRSGIVANKPGSGQFIAKANGQLTDFVNEFIEYYVKNGGQSRAAFLQAGGDSDGVRQGVAALMGSKKVREAIRQRQVQRMVSMANMAAATVEDLMLCEDGTVPAAVRFQAAKWCMETAGVGPQFSEAGKPGAEGGDKPLEEMSIRELEAFITAGGQAVKQQRQERERTIDVTPDQRGPGQ